MEKKADNPISREEAITLLFQNTDEPQDQENIVLSNECMDEYGNYVFSTDR